MSLGTRPIICFNTQPPEGGWLTFLPPEGVSIVSTHSRLKAAGNKNIKTV